ncbi:MAG: putative Ig domain-containing protein [Fibrobacterota bacterium]
MDNFRCGLAAGYDSLAQFTHNVITNTAWGVRVGYGMGAAAFNYNTFSNASGYLFAMGNYVNGPNIDARFNFWGEATAQMTAGGNPKNITQIYDYYDYSGVATINYANWLTVPTGNLPPYVSSSPVLAIKAGYPYSYPVTAGDPNSDALTYTLLQNPSGMTVNGSGLVQWTAGIAGSYPVVLEVADASESIKQSWTVVVTADVIPPVNNYTLTATGITDSIITLFWSPGGNSPDADSIGIWYKQGDYPTSPSDVGATLTFKWGLTGGGINPAHLLPLTRYYFALFVRDSSGNWSASGALAQARTLDLTKPVNLMTLTTSRYGSSDSVQVSWNAAAMAGSDADSVRIRFDVDRFATYANDNNGTYGFQEYPLATGSYNRAPLFENTPYYITLFVRDTSGNWSDTTPTSRQLLIMPDLTKPAAPVNFQVSWLGGSAYRMTSEPYYQDAESVFVRVRTDGTYPVSHTDGAFFKGYRANALNDTLTTLSERTTYYFAAFVRDSAGNWSDTASTARCQAYISDVTAPVNKALFSADSSDSGIVLTWTGDSISEPDVMNARILVSQVRAPSNPNGDSVTTLLSFSLPTLQNTAFYPNASWPLDTTLYFGLLFKDSTGNFSSIKVDSTRRIQPRPMNVANLNATGVDSSTVLVNWDRPLSPLDSVLLRFDTDRFHFSPIDLVSAVKKKWVSGTDTFATFTGLTGGTVYYITAFTMAQGRMNDTVNQISQFSVFTQTYAPTAPVITTTSPLLTVKVDSLYTYDVDALDANGDVVTFSLSDPPSGMTINASTGIVTWTPGALQTAPVSVIASDGAFTDTLSWTITVQANNTAPVILTKSSDFPDSIPEQQLFNFQVVAEDPDTVSGDSIIYSLNGPGGLTINSRTGLMQWTPAASDIGASQPCTLVIIDSKGLLDTLAFSLRVYNVNAPPIITTAFTLDSVLEDAAYSRTLTSTDADVADNRAWSFLAGPTGLAVHSATGTVTWTPTNANVGDTTVSVMVMDLGGLSDTLTYTLRVKNVNDAPVVSGLPPSDTAVEDSPWTLTAGVTDPDAGDTHTWSIVSGPAGLAISAAGVMTWTPSNTDVGGRSLTIRVTDAGGLSATSALTLVVTNVNDAPSFTTVLTLDSVYEDALYSRTLAATDPDVGDVLAYGLVTAPTGMTLNSTTGAVSWTPSNADVKVPAVIFVKVQDVTGLSDTISYTLRVLNVNDAPVLAALAPDSVYEDSAYARTLRATDPDSAYGEGLTFSLLGKPAGMRIDSATGFLSWTPSNVNVGVSPLAVVVTDKAGAADTASFTLKVLNTNDAPTVRLAETPSVLFGAVKVRLVFDDPDRLNGLDSLLSYRTGLWDAATAETLFVRQRAAADVSVAIEEFYPVYADSVIFFAKATDLSASGSASAHIAAGSAGQSLVQKNLPPAEWLMVSLPSKNAPIASELLDPSKRIYRWSLNGYIDPEAGLSQFEQGKGYWLNADSAVRLIVADTGHRLTGVNTACSLAVDTGWNMMASPYAYAVRMPGANDTLFYWNGTDYLRTNVLEPWKGYFYYSSAGQALHFDGTPFNPDSVQRLARRMAKNALYKSAKEWMVRLVASGARSQDRDNLFGLNPLSKPSLDGLDQYEPPRAPVSAGVRVWFETDDHALSRSLTNASTGTGQWILAMDPGSDKGSIAITLEGLADLPGNLYVFFGDRNDYTDLRKAGKVSVQADSLRYYTVVVTDDKDFLSKVVRNYELAQNAPNPFNPATRIQYAIPSLYDAKGKPLATQPQVSLKLYDLRGRLVRTLADGPQAAGKRYDIQWNGREANSHAAASGMYVYRIDIGGKFVQSKKMVLVK